MATLAPVPVPQRRVSLYENIEAVETILDTLDSLDAGDAEAREELGQMLIARIAGTRAKVDSTCRVLAALEAAADAAVAERARLDKRVKYFTRQAERLENYVLSAMSSAQLDVLDGDTGTLKRRKNPPKLIVVNAALVPVEYLRWPDPLPDPDPVMDNPAIKAAIKAGAEVPGTRVDQSYRLVRE